MAAKRAPKKKPECGAMVDGGMMSYPCAVEGKDHDGPCAAVEVDRSQRERARWLEGERAKATLAGFQGEPQTTAQRNTENPTPVPRSKGQRTHERDDAAWEAEQRAKALAATRAQLVKEFGEEAVAKIEAGVDGGMAAASEVLAARERALSPLLSLDSATGAVTVVPEGARSPTKTREGDQRLPVASDMPGSHAAVQADLAERLRVGMERYGQPLQALNGRNGFLDLYEEILDASVYCKTVMLEREAMATLAATLKNRLGYLQAALADLQVEAHSTYEGAVPIEDSPVDVLIVHPEEMEAIDRLLAWLQA